MGKKRGRPPTFDVLTRKYFASLIERHGLRGACEASKIPVSPATMAKVVKEFGIRLLAGRRPSDPCQVPRQKLSKVQQEQLAEILALGPLAAGYRTDRWTCRRIADVIQKTFQVKCHPIHLKPMLRKLGLSLVERPAITLRVRKDLKPSRKIDSPGAEGSQSKAA